MDQRKTNTGKENVVIITVSIRAGPVLIYWVIEGDIFIMTKRILKIVKQQERNITWEGALKCPVPLKGRQNKVSWA